MSYGLRGKNSSMSRAKGIKFGRADTGDGGECMNITKKDLPMSGMKGKNDQR